MGRAGKGEVTEAQLLDVSQPLEEGVIEDLELVGLDTDGTVVPGLWAAGRSASGIPAQGYNSGLSLADCTFSGRMAGVSVAGAGD